MAGSAVMPVSAVKVFLVRESMMVSLFLRSIVFPFQLRPYEPHAACAREAEEIFVVEGGDQFTRTKTIPTLSVTALASANMADILSSLPPLR
jgi:hypothetical protein